MLADSTGTAPATTWRKRLQGFLCGGLFFAMGYWLVAHGVYVFPGRYRAPVFSYSAIASGVVLVLASAAPSWLILRMTALKKYRPYQGTVALRRDAALTGAAKPK
ncbi:MAG TPA: hypothetical protein VH724_15205 [Candidatus Angelobacter sp.]|jgi:hypothetical protein|nr:hypothetical protein [Candidatus Angelobacter sp.]